MRSPATKVRAETARRISNNRRSALIAASLAALLPILGLVRTARADIFQWEYINPANPALGKQPSLTLAPDGAGANAVPGTDLSYRNLTKAYLIGADLSPYYDWINDLSYPSDLTGVNLSQADLTNASLVGASLFGANLSQANLTNATFSGASLAGANLTGAEVRGANLGSTGITTDQLYSTASYQSHDLAGIRLSWSNLAGWNFAGQNLTGADFSFATLTGADLSGADARGANFQYATLARTNSSNMIQSDGHIAGLDLAAGASLVVRAYDGDPNRGLGPIPVTVQDHVTLGNGSAVTVNGGTLRFALTSGSPTIGTGVQTAVNGSATLELAGSASALANGADRVNITNNSTAPGILVSGTNQQVGKIDGHAPPRRSVCAPAAMSLHCIADPYHRVRHSANSMQARRNP
jgi:uncharacterized protein YjbI with pentapeptide repeats